ncbi:cupin domain-containing protein [Pseudogemmobacter sonorensis]|uniref:cupin domain-containing protein n=1 Tax=Pseudogemmobacter sonorensis TaxID=2989681 RepID=UPI003F6616BE
MERPAPEKRLAGDPVHTSWSIEETPDGIFCGLWQATPGKWKVAYSEWEYVLIHEGHSILTDAQGRETHLKAGDRFVIRPGFEGTWEVIETTLKDYVIKV